MSPFYSMAICAGVVAGLVLGTGCATTGTPRFLFGALAGGAIGGGSGFALSPNPESRVLNGLVFGLTGALVGGGLAFLTDPNLRSTSPSSFKDREIGTGHNSSRQFSIEPADALPPFVRERIQPVVVEEFVERDRVTEEGVLHEPHKAYRIKRPAELSPRPLRVQNQAPPVAPLGEPVPAPPAAPPPRQNSLKP